MPEGAFLVNSALVVFVVACVAAALGIPREGIWDLVKGIVGLVLIVQFMVLTLPYWYLLNEYWWVPLAGIGAYLAIIWIGFGIFWIYQAIRQRLHRQAG